ncbi:acid phosphatase type 7-like [Branchiostoma floridae]|uniref:Acid phosphatase type 7-like n=1 Tax=Branchiostoma floridae TaxID=7739 RepID=A0A9J7MS48_BRAFL|nr:acid phosphatase type 7-like [Branchiostoma floridae]
MLGMKNPEVALLVVVLLGHAGLQPHLCAAGETRRLTDFLQRSDSVKTSSGQVFMSQVGSGGRLKERFRVNNQPGSESGPLKTKHVSQGRLPVQVRAGDVQGLHLSLSGAGQVRAMWLNPVPFTAPSDFQPRCVYTVLPSGDKTEERSRTRGVCTDRRGGASLHLHRRELRHGTLNEAVMTYAPGSVPLTIHYQCGDRNYVMSQQYNVTVQPTTMQKTQELQNKRKVNSLRKSSSETFSKASPGLTYAGGEREGKVALIADMGIEEDSFTIKSLLHQADRGELDLVLHAGDLSYADNFGTTFGSGDGNNSWVWVQYMTSLHDVTARVPYMTCPGNHEAQFDFAAYRNWLHMPGNESGSSSPYYYSFDYLGVHFVGISTEHDMRGNSSQHRWLEQDLRTADQNRARTPWILVFGHRPLYCSSAIFWSTRCTTEAREFRSDLEELFRRYHVDVYVCGHNHQYERSWPVSGGNVTAKNYRNPAATVHIVSGAAGNPEGNDPTYVPEFLVPWRAGYSLSLQTGWTLMEVNSTALAFSYIHSADLARMVDSFTITKTQ